MSNYAKRSEKCRSGSSAGIPQRRHFWGAFLWFIHPAELISGVAASDKQTQGSKLIKNGEVNSAPSEEMKFSQISRGFALKTSCFTPEWMIYKNRVFKVPQSLTHNLDYHHYHQYSYVSQEGLEIIFDQFHLTQLQVQAVNWPAVLAGHFG